MAPGLTPRSSRSGHSTDSASTPPTPEGFHREKMGATLLGLPNPQLQETLKGSQGGPH